MTQLHWVRSHGDVDPPRSAMDELRVASAAVSEQEVELPASSEANAHSLPETVQTLTFPRQADPPLSGGVEHHSAGDHAAAGGCSGFPLPESPPHLNAWDVLTGQALELAPLRELLEDCEENGNLRSGVVLRSLDRIRDALELIPEGAELDTVVPLRLGDVAVLMRQMLQRLR